MCGFFLQVKFATHLLASLAGGYWKEYRGSETALKNYSQKLKQNISKQSHLLKKSAKSVLFNTKKYWKNTQLILVFRGSVKFPPTNSLFGFKMSDFHLADIVITKVKFLNSPGENFLQILQRT